MGQMTAATVFGRILTLVISMLVLQPAWAVNGPWSMVYQKPLDADLKGIATNGTVDVAIGDRGAVLTSTDGTHWQRVTTGYEGLRDNLVSLVWTGHEFYVIGDAGLILTSSDGTHWQGQFPLPGSYFGAVDGFTSIASGGGQVVVSDPAGLNLNTKDGSSWAATDLSKQRFYGTYELLWFAGNFYGLESELQSSSDGLNLDRVVSFPGGAVCAAATDGHIIVALDESGHSYTTADAKSWSSAGPQTADSCFMPGDSQVQWTGKDFAWLLPGGKYYSSTDGLNWTLRHVSIGVDFAQLIWDGAQYIGVGAQGMIATSPDGVTFTQVAGVSGGGSQAESVAWTGSTYVVGLNNLSGAISLEVGSGSTWQAVAQPIEHVTFTEGSLYGFDYPTGKLMTSTDGITWTASSLSAAYTAIAGDGSSQVIALGQSAEAVSSDSGATWGAPTAATFSQPPIKLIHANGKYVAISNNYLFYSTDGNSWVSTLLDPLVAFHGITDVLYGNGLYIVLTQENTEYTSPDAIHWTKRTPLPGNNSNTLWRAVWDGKEFVATSNYAGGVSSPPPSGSSLWTSTDAITWYPELMPPGMTPTALGLGSGEVLISGQLGQVATAVPGKRAVPVADPVSVNVTAGDTVNGSFLANDANNRPLLYSSTYGGSYDLGNGYTWSIPHQAQPTFGLSIPAGTAPQQFSFDYLASNDVVYSAPAKVSVTVTAAVTPPPAGGGGSSGGGGGTTGGGGGGIGVLDLCACLLAYGLRRKPALRRC